MPYNESGQLICNDDQQGEEIRILHNIEDGVVRFLRENEDLRPLIMFREVYEKKIIEIEFRSNNAKEDYRAGIIHTHTPKQPWGEVHLEDSWYAYKYTMD